MIQDTYEQFIHKSRYARWLDDEQRREDWDETVTRYMNYMHRSLLEHDGYEMPETIYNRLFNAIYDREIFPSMRALMTAGPALERNNVAAYNCAFIAVDEPRAFDEHMFILMNGTGVGFSVEAKYTSQLPVIPYDFKKEGTIHVSDSKEGWALALRNLVAGLYAGNLPANIDVSEVRPAGAKLKTFGGRASGPEPLVELFDFVITKFMQSRGRRLAPVEVHDIMCKIGEVVVVGGVRRSACISLSDLSDEVMAHAKSGEWWNEEPQRRLANNSAVYESKPSKPVFEKEWKALIASNSGERGIISRYGMQQKCTMIGRDGSKIAGINPCAEIFLRNKQFCNLTTTVVRPEDGLEEMVEKVELATILGTYQSTLTRFDYLSDDWKTNTEEERLLGVSMTGQFGNKLFSGQSGLDELAEVLDELKQVARQTNANYADEIGIQRSAAITTVKPEGTTSQLAGVSSGMSPWHDKYFNRNVRGDKKDPMSRFMRDAGILTSNDVMAKDSTYVHTFPRKAPENAITRHELTAMQHLQVWMVYAEHWAEHNPSVTINVRDDEWDEVGEWVYENFDRICGLSFLPYDGGSYKQAPYETIDAEEYQQYKALVPDSVDWHELQRYEHEDTTTGSQSLACVAGGCDITYV